MIKLPLQVAFNHEDKIFENQTKYSRLRLVLKFSHRLWFNWLERFAFYITTILETKDRAVYEELHNTVLTLDQLLASSCKVGEMQCVAECLDTL